MQVPNSILQRFPPTKAEEWRQINEAWVHSSAIIGEKATIRGGVVRGGVVSGGLVSGGVVRESLLCICGLLPWIASTSGPNELAIGCERHTIEEWESNVETIAALHCAEPHIPTIHQVIALAKQWFIDHPNAITPEETVQ